MQTFGTLPTDRIDYIWDQSFIRRKENSKRIQTLFTTSNDRRNIDSRHTTDKSRQFCRKCIDVTATQERGAPWRTKTQRRASMKSRINKYTTWQLVAPSTAA